MCLAVLALDAHQDWPVVLAANRDEFHARPAAPAAWWPEGILAGRDLEAGGTWLGVTRDGRWALLTNVREPQRHDPAASSRGAIVPSLLAVPADPLAAIGRMLDDGARYNGFNAIAGAKDRAAWGSNRGERIRPLAPGVHGLSNAALDTPWPKVVRTRDRVERWAASRSSSLDPLWEALADRALAADAELPATGVSLEWERRLSAPFIVSPGYGTRCSTLLLVGSAGRIRFVERSFDPSGALVGEVDETFRLAAA